LFVYEKTNQVQVVRWVFTLHNYEELDYVEHFSRPEFRVKRCIFGYKVTGGGGVISRDIWSCREASGKYIFCCEIFDIKSSVKSNSNRPFNIRYYIYRLNHVLRILLRGHWERARTNAVENYK